MRTTVRWVTLVALLVAAAPAGAEPIVTMGTGEGPAAAGGTSCTLGTIQFPDQVAPPPCSSSCARRAVR